MIVVDGHEYKTRAEAPDLGSLVGRANIDGTRSYTGDNADYTKLPVYDDLASGSDATLADDAGVHVYIYNGTKWCAC